MTRYLRRPIKHITDRGRHHGGIVLDGFGEPQVHADCVFDEPRQPHIIPTGVLDERGFMLCRVVIPIKQKMGFKTGPDWDAEAEDCVISIAPEDMLRTSYGLGEGIASVQPWELEEYEADMEDDGDDA